MTTPAFHRAAARNQAEIAEHARQTSAAAAHATELIDAVLADEATWKGDLIAWVRDR